MEKQDNRAKSQESGLTVMTVLGTRPEIIRLSRIIPRLDDLCRHILVHTGQNFDKHLSDIFFEQMGVRKPDHFLNARGESPADQIGQILKGCEKLFNEHKPDKLLLLGDTNSALCAIIAKRLGIPVYHMEAGNRCYDDRVPEEVNRRIIDHSSDILLPYTGHARRGLRREGIHDSRIYVTGNPIYEVIEHYRPQFEKSDILKRLGIKKGKYFLVTLHRAENVDESDRLENILAGLDQIGASHDFPVIMSTHPRLEDRMEQAGFKPESYQHIRFEPPFGFFDFLQLELNAACVLTDSGTVQEETAIYQIPSVTLRDVTERPETVECGSNILVGACRNRIVSAVASIISGGRRCQWQPPGEYLKQNVSDTVVKIMISDMSYREKGCEKV